LLLGLYGVAVLLPTMPVSVRRLHGMGRSGWWALIGLVPLIGFVVLLVLHATEGDNGDNEYSPDPRNAERSGAATKTAPHRTAEWSCRRWMKATIRFDHLNATSHGRIAPGLTEALVCLGFGGVALLDSHATVMNRSCSNCIG